MYLSPLSLVLCLVTLGLHLSSADEKDPTVENSLKIFNHLADTRKGLSTLKHIVSEIDTDLQQAQKRTCVIGGGMSQHCIAAGLDRKILMSDWLHNGLSPGRKRATLSHRPAPIARALAPSSLIERRLDDLAKKRKGLEILERILNEMEADLMYEQKRTCHFNLGGHCATESAAYVADHWHYLNSPLSPGRKRRDTRLYNTLISGKLFKPNNQ